MRSDRLYLQDMLDAIAEIRRYLPSDRSAFDSNPLLQSHILRHVQIVGEAAARIAKQTKDAHPQIPWRQISGMRHILVHDYFRVDWNILFTTARDDIPTLEPLIHAIVASWPPNGTTP
jgi:uncharacterized protein with HEPN domain